jgi:hypothetical protein
VTLTANPNPAIAGQTITLTATVTGNGTSMPTGTVTFKDGGNALGAPVALSGNVATLAVALEDGPHSVTAVYSGNTNFVGATSSPVTEVVQTLTATTTTISTSAASANLGSAVTFTATVTSSAGTPAGTVSFFDGSNTLGSGGLSSGTLSSGTVTLTTSALSAGTHVISASYGGSSTFAPSNSSGMLETIVGPDFSISASASSLSLAAGQSSTVTLTITPVGGFSGPVSFSCGNTTAVTCTFNPATVTPLGTPVTTTLTILAPKSSTASMHQTSSFGALGMGVVLLGAAWRKYSTGGKRTKNKIVATLAYGLALAALAGCGGSTTTTNVNTPAQINTITISATAGNMNHGMALVVVVQ